MKNSEPSARILLDEFQKFKIIKPDISEKKINFEKKFEILNLNFKYHNKDDVFKNLNLQIQANTKIGIIGESGSGKSTFINLICGFLKGQGDLVVDGLKISKNNLISWQKNISIVQQDIFLFNESIKDNIALLKTGERIDENKLLLSIKNSQLDEFVKNQN